MQTETRSLHEAEFSISPCMTTFMSSSRNYSRVQILSFLLSHLRETLKGQQ